MLDSKQLTTQAGMELLGELHPFADQLGSPEGLSSLAAEARFLQLKPADLPALRLYLKSYCSEVLIGCELPAIYEAYGHASRNGVRELIAFDSALRGELRLQPFAEVSRYLGNLQLRKLRALRDQRLVQRYLDAVESGEGFGWHTVVYGLILSLYSLPLRQGLQQYGERTIAGFIHSANRSLRLPKQQCQSLGQEICLSLPEAIRSILNHVALPKDPLYPNGANLNSAAASKSGDA